MTSRLGTGKPLTFFYSVLVLVLLPMLASLWMLLPVMFILIATAAVVDIAVADVLLAILESQLLMLSLLLLASLLLRASLLLPTSH